MHAAGLIIKGPAGAGSNFRSSATLSDYLQREGTVAIANIDTRRLTRHPARSKGAAERLHPHAGRPATVR